jgi:hypothetical protein
VGHVVVGSVCRPQVQHQTDAGRRLRRVHQWARCSARVARWAGVPAGCTLGASMPTSETQPATSICFSPVFTCNTGRSMRRTCASVSILQLEIVPYVCHHGSSNDRGTGWHRPLGSSSLTPGPRNWMPWTLGSAVPRSATTPSPMVTCCSPATCGTRHPLSLSARRDSPTNLLGGPACREGWAGAALTAARRWTADRRRVGLVGPSRPVPERTDNDSVHPVAMDMKLVTRLRLLVLETRAQAHSGESIEPAPRSSGPPLEHSPIGVACACPSAEPDGDGGVNTPR